jgi:hypothetical protein
VGCGEIQVTLRFIFAYRPFSWNPSKNIIGNKVLGKTVVKNSNPVSDIRHLFPHVRVWCTKYPGYMLRRAAACEVLRCVLVEPSF